MCPKPGCGSHDVKITERGAIWHTYYCNECKESYQKVSPGAKWKAAMAVGGVIVTGGIGGAFIAFLS